MFPSYNTECTYFIKALVMDSNTNIKFGNKNVKKKIVGLIYTDH